MAKPGYSTKKPFSPEWKSIGIGVVAGIILLTLIIRAGGSLEEWSFLGLKFAFSTPVPTSSYTTSEQKVLSLEDIPSWIFSYGFGNEYFPPTHFSILTVVNEANQVKTYKLDFSMPNQGEAAAGISFTLEDPINLAEYANIELSAKFKNSQCDLFLKDTETKGGFVTISESTLAPMRTGLENGKWQFQIAISNFSGINMQSIKEVGCNAHRCEGECSFELSDVRFTSP